MKATLRLLIAVCLFAALSGGCSKKKPTARRDAESAPATETAAASQTAEPTATREPAKPAAPAPIEGVPEELVAQDAAYEAWFKKYNLDLTDPKMLDADPDNDGFTNREEFLADTNPLDPNARPGVATGIKLKEFVRKELPFVLKSVQGETAQLERGEEGAKRKETVKSGQAVPGSSYKVVRVQSRQTRDKDGNPMDGSRVTLEDTSTKQRVDLVKDMPARSSASYAILAAPDGGKTVTVHDGETFSWGEPPVSYKVKDLRAEQVILEEVATRKIVTVPKE
jgi:hypothetical protein